MNEMDLRRDLHFNDFTLINFVNLNDEEREIVRRWRNNESIMKWMFQDHIISSEEHINFIKKLNDDNKNLYWLIRDDKGEYIGVISLNRIDLRNKNAYLGIYTSPEIELHGMGRILMGCVRELISDKLTLHTLKLEVIETNERAINFYKRSGFNEEGRLKDFVLRDGKWHDVIIMGILNKEKV